MENPVLPSSCVTPAGTSIEVQNEWEENTHTHTHTHILSISCSVFLFHVVLVDFALFLFKEKSECTLFKEKTELI